MRCVFVGLLVLPALVAAPLPSSEPDVRRDASGRLVYTAASDGDRVPDFSGCGYRHGAEPPVVPVVLKLAPTPSGDDTERVQKALDAVAARTPDANGLRGALLLTKGEYRIGGSLKITAGGVVLRGEGDGEAGTVLRATGKTPRALIAVGGGDFRGVGTVLPVASVRVPVGATRVPLTSVNGLSVGSPVTLLRHGNAEWIHAIGMDDLPQRGDGKPVVNWSAFSVSMDRVVTAIDGDTVTLDAPVVCAIDPRWGGGELRAARDTRIGQSAVENLRGESDYDASVTAKQGKTSYASDEAHATYLVAFGAVKNAWATKLTTRHFVHGPVSLGAGGRCITVSGCSALDPVSIITGGRRYPFANNGAQLALFRDCFADHARHAFVYGARVAGPNVFLRCRSQNDHASSEPHHRWSTGGLYDRCETSLTIMNRGSMGSGHGWAGANFVAWNCKGAISCESPPTARNLVFGHVGKRHPGPFHGPDAVWVSFGKPVEPPSLYEAQLAERLGHAAPAPGAR